MSQVVSEILLNLAVTAVLSVLIYWCYRGSITSRDSKYHTFRPRFFSPFIDGLVLWPLVGGAGLLMALFQLPAIIVVLLTLIAGLAHHVYTIYLHGIYGQTVGKMVCKIRVVNAKGEGPISLRKAFVRDSIPLLMTILLFVVSKDVIFSSEVGATNYLESSMMFNLIPLIWFIAEMITMLTNEKRRAIHDFIAGTVVIRLNTIDDIASKTIDA